MEMFTWRQCRRNFVKTLVFCVAVGIVSYLNNSAQAGLIKVDSESSVWAKRSFQFNSTGKYLLWNPYFCTSSTKTVIIASSQHLSDNKRGAVRQTWKSVINVDEEAVLFVFGARDNGRYQYELKKHGDILVANYYEKVSEALPGFYGLHWVLKNCHSVTKIIKTREDAFIHMGNLRALTNDEKYQDPAVIIKSDFYRNYLRETNKPLTYIIKTSQTSRLLTSLERNASYILKNSIPESEFVKFIIAEQNANLYTNNGIRENDSSDGAMCSILAEKFTIMENVFAEMLVRVWSMLATPASSKHILKRCKSLGL